MRTRYFAAVLACFCALAGTSVAANLDDPGANKPTIRSEILRGRYATLTCDPVIMEMAEYETCIEHVLTTAAVNNAISPAFMVGLTWSAFYGDALRVQVAQGRQKTPSQAELAITKKAFDAYQLYAKQTGVATEQLCEVTGLNKQTCAMYLDMVKYWSQK
jgi:hypothetical protein